MDFLTVALLLLHLHSLTLSLSFLRSPLPLSVVAHRMSGWMRPQILEIFVITAVATFSTLEGAQENDGNIVIRRTSSASAAKNNGCGILTRRKCVAVQRAIQALWTMPTTVYTTPEFLLYIIIAVTLTYPHKCVIRNGGRWPNITSNNVYFLTWLVDNESTSLLSTIWQLQWNRCYM